MLDSHRLLMLLVKVPVLGLVLGRSSLDSWIVILLLGAIHGQAEGCCALVVRSGRSLLVVVIAQAGMLSIYTNFTFPLLAHYIPAYARVLGASLYRWG